MPNCQLILTSVLSLVLVLSTLFGASSGVSQKSPAATPPELMTRTSTRHELRHFGYGGTVTVVAAPKGSVTVEGWQRSEVEVTADIELQAENEADLDQLAKVNSFAFDDDANHVSILTTGTHDRSYMKKSAKNFPKRLLNLPWKIDYRIRVPASTDVEINAGHGPVNVSGFEGAIRISAVESETSLTLTGGVVSATVTAGKVRLVVPVRSWRGSGADIRIAAGVLTVELPPGFNGDIDADILRTGRIENAFEGLAPREKPGIGDRIVRARAGAGGAFFKFTVGDGTINIRKAGEGG
jgi:hypothetical protein